MTLNKTKSVWQPFWKTSHGTTSPLVTKNQDVPWCTRYWMIMLPSKRTWGPHSARATCALLHRTSCSTQGPNLPSMDTPSSHTPSGTGTALPRQQGLHPQLRSSRQPSTSNHASTTGFIMHLLLSCTRVFNVLWALINHWCVLSCLRGQHTTSSAGCEVGNSWLWTWTWTWTASIFQGFQYSASHKWASTNAWPEQHRECRLQTTGRSQPQQGVRTRPSPSTSPEGVYQATHASNHKLLPAVPRRGTHTRWQETAICPPNLKESIYKWPSQLPHGDPDMNPL